jgi:hypothetical protein
MDMNTKPKRIDVHHHILPPNFVGGWTKGQVMIVVDAEASGKRALVSALPKNKTFAAE